MTFLSFPFLLLMILLIPLLHFVKGDRPVKLVLLVSGYVFYAFFDIRSLILLIVLSIFTWAGGRLIVIKKNSGLLRASKALCISLITAQLLILCFFKYSGLFPMPVGLSFYMLQTIGFLVDCLRGDLSDPLLLDTLLYISFFPVIVSGPIQKAKDFIPRLSARKSINSERFSHGIQLFVLGAFMKLVMADRLAVSVNAVYDAPAAYSALTLFITSIAYSLQLLFDFAGYSNMAVGIAHLLGFDLAPNFNLPYLAISPADFWRRWHISLSTWLRDYVYIPLGGNRKGKVRTFINIFLTMVISGLWHGSTVNFLIWGFLHGLWQVIYRLLFNDRKKISFPHRLVSATINFLIVNLLWIPFRAPTLNDAWIIISRIITFKPGIGYYYVYTFIFGIMLLIIQAIADFKNNCNNPIKPLPLNKMFGRIIFCCLIIAVFMFAYFGNGAFIYAQF